MIKTFSTILAIFFLAQTSAFEFCENGQVGESNLRLISIDDMLKDNSKEWTWSTSEKIEIEARVENKNDESETYILEAIFMDGDDEIIIAKDSDDLKKEFSLSANERKSVSLNFQIDEDTEEDTYDLYIKFYKKGSEDEECVENSEEQIKIEKIELCENGNVDEDDLEIKGITDEQDDNEITWEWKPGSDVGIAVDLKNEEYSSRTFVVELIMFDENNKEIIFTENSENPSKEVTLDEDESDDVKLYFTLSSEIEEGEYTLYAKAYDESDENICTSQKAESNSDPKIITIKRPQRKVAVIDVSGPTEVKTSEKIDYKVIITNLGSKDEEKVSVLAYNYKLGIKEIKEISNLDSGETENLTFNFAIPENASLSKQAISFSVGYEYNSRLDYYESESEDEDSIRHYITISQGTAEEEIANKTITEPTQNETDIPTTTISGNVVKDSNGTFNWIIAIGLLALALTGGYFFIKPKKHKQPKHIEPKITRRYTARLS
ncbi:hypothetical protein K8R30_04400 [archaeon]|nr:hypothetical protein [archaeon]